MYRFCFVLFSLVLSLPALAEEAPPHFTFTSDTSEQPVMAAGGIESETLPDRYALTQTRTEKRPLAAAREWLLDRLGVSRLVPHGQFTALGLQTHWTLTLSDEETVALKLNARW